jgi:hypothetical protein
VLWDGTKLINLNSFIPADSNWRLALATEINSKGQILGVGYHDGAPREFLLTPGSNAIPLPSAAMAGAFTLPLVLCGVEIRRRSRIRT